MRAGTLDRQITVQKKQVTQDASFGTEVITWVPLVAQAGSPTVAERFRANLQDVMPSRSEGLSENVNVARNLTRCRLRWRSDIDSSMRVIVHGDGSDVMYNIIAGPADIDGRKSMIELMLERVSS